LEQQDLQNIRDWFNSFVKTFHNMDEEGLQNILLKEEHTAKVVESMEQIATSEGLNSEEINIASAVALLHDVGRFPQYRRWRTFRDRDSDNHARLSVDTIRAHKVIDHFPQELRLLIEEAIRFHNLLALPARVRSKTDLYIRLIRDADKLDIWRVFMEYYSKPEAERPSAVGLGLADLPLVSKPCVEALAAGKIVTLDTVKVLNDFKLLQISWAYDLNFSSSYRLLEQRQYIQKLAATLPATPDLAAAVETAVAHTTKMSSR
jgi:HD domain